MQLDCPRGKFFDWLHDNILESMEAGRAHETGEYPAPWAVYALFKWFWTCHLDVVNLVSVFWSQNLDQGFEYISVSKMSDLIEQIFCFWLVWGELGIFSCQIVPLEIHTHLFSSSPGPTPWLLRKWERTGIGAHCGCQICCWSLHPVFLAISLLKMIPFPNFIVSVSVWRCKVPVLASQLNRIRPGTNANSSKFTRKLERIGDARILKSYQLLF